MYRAAIIDDEPDVREGLRLLVDWEKSGWEIVGEAGNGAEALEHIPVWKPDLIITDIRMPVLDGLALARRVREQFPRTVVIVMSAYSEFEYAQEALRLGVSDFLLKPVAGGALRQLLAQVKESFDAEVRTRWREREQLQIVQEKWLCDFCQGKPVKPYGTGGVWDWLVDDGRSRFQVLLIQMDDYHVYVDQMPESELELKRYMIRNIALELASGCCSSQAYEDAEDRIGLLIKQEPPFTSVASLAENIRNSLLEFVGIRVSIGIGSAVSQWREIRSSRKEASAALQYVFLEGKGAILDFKEVERARRLSGSEFAPDWSVRPVLEAVEEGRMKDAAAALNDIFAAMRKHAPPEWFRVMNMELFAGLLQLIRQHNGGVSEVFGDNPGTYGPALSSRTLEDMKKSMIVLCEKTSAYLAELRSTRLPGVMQEVKAYIDSNYHEDISLKQIAGHVYKNSVYLGQLFKATFGETFGQYLTRIRIAKAKEMLRKDDLRVYEIADKVGYANLDTFYQKFKQMTGMNPTEYRQRLRVTDRGQNL